MTHRFSTRYSLARITRIACACAVAAIGLSMPAAPVALASPLATTIVVQPGSLNGWTLGAAASLVFGPTAPPVGSGSLALATTPVLSVTGASQPLTGTQFSALTKLTYATHTPLTSAVPSLRAVIDLTSTDLLTGDQGMLVYDPTVASSGSVLTSTWQVWDALSGRWYASGPAGALAAACPITSPCTLGAILGIYPNLSAHAISGTLSIEARAAVTATMYADDLNIGVSGNTTIYDFERCGPGCVDLGISKTAPATALAGSLMTYTVEIVNHGGATSNPVTVTDTLPIGVGASSITSTLGSCVLGTSITCTLPGLAPAERVTATLVVTAPLTGGTITNTARLSSTLDLTATNNASFAATFIQAPAIALTKTVGTANSCGTSNALVVGPGTAVQYCYTVRNTGNVSLTTHALTDTQLGSLIGSLVFTLTPGASTVVTAPATIATTTVNTASWFAGFGSTPVTVTASAVATVTVISNPADLSVVKTSTPYTVPASGLITYTITLTNNGPSPAQSVVVTDTLPPGATLATALRQAAVAESNIVFTFGTLSVGEVKTIAFVVRAPLARGLITNTVTVNASNEVSPTNNIAFAVNNVQSTLVYLPLIAKGN
jgi:uncharacterized repeat protein (TIGR01451 family)